MEMMKRILALLLVCAMLMPNLSTIALAAETEDLSAVSEETIVAETEPSEVQTEAPGEATDPPAATEPAAVETEPAAGQTEAPVTQETVTVEETVTAAAANEESAAELVTRTLTVEDSVAPDSAYTNDDMFAMYLDRLMYPDKPSTLGTGGYNALDSKHQALYNALKNQIANLAANGGSSVYGPTASDLEQMGFKVTMTAQEVTGQEYVTEFTEEHLAKVKELFDLDFSSVVDALLADLPYELYWYDKQAGSKFEYGINIQYYEQDGEFRYVGWGIYDPGFFFQVADEYQGDSALSVSSVAATAASGVVAAAQDVVSVNAEKCDYDKLVAYRDYICQQVSYNKEAAKPTYTGGYGDPWQVIYVFDEDSSTNVVCEGYAKAFQYLCDLSDFDGDVESYLVSGYAGGPHMWNIVSVGGRNYLVDVTNTDPNEDPAKITFGQDGTVFMAGTAGSIADGYTFTNTNGNELTYTYAYQDGGEQIQPAIDVYGDDEDSILHLSFLDYQEYLDISAGQEELLNGDSLEGDIWIVDDVELHELGEKSGLNLTVSGATLKLIGYTALSGGSITLENGARLLVEGDLYLRDGSSLNLGDNTFLQIEGDADNRQGTVYVHNEASLTAEDTDQILVPDGAIYADFYTVDSRITNVAPEKLTVQAWVMDHASLRNSVNDMDSEKDKYHRYEITANSSFAVEEDLEIPAPIAFEVHNWGDWNNPVVLTIPEGITLKISGCYMGIYEGTQLQVEGTMIDDGYLRTHENSSVRVVGNGVLEVLGHLDNQGVVYADSEDQLVRDENTTWENNDPIFADTEVASYMSLRWLDNWGNGWFENHNNGTVEGFRIDPGSEYYMIAYLNQWNSDTLTWDTTPIHATKLVVDENLVLEPFSAIHDGGNHVEDGENFDCFFRIRGAEGKCDIESAIFYSNTDIHVTVELGRHAGGFYSADPTAAGADANSLWLNNFCVTGESKTFWFWFDPSRYHEEGWTVGEVTVSPDREIGTGVQVNKVGTNLWKLTVSDDTAQRIYSLRDFWLHLDYTLVKGEDSRSEGVDINCYGEDFGESNASFDIDGVRYNASWNYDGLFRYEQDGNGDWYPVPAEIEGVSYDIHSNTLTLNGAHLETLHIDHHWHDDRTGEEGWNLPDSRFNIELVGDDNTITATNEHALLISDDVHLTILGEGSLTISSRNASSAFQANDSDVTIAGNAKVDVSISGEVFYEENGETRREYMNAIWCNGAGRWLRLRDNAVLTTHVPEGVCTNGYFDQDGNFVEDGGYNGLQFSYIEVNDNATLNTQIIRVWDEGRGNAFGAYYQNGGTVNVTGLPHYNKDNRNENDTVGHYHFSGVEADYGLIEINGGVLNLNINATEEQMAKSVYYHGLQSRGRRIDLNGGVINVNGNISGAAIKVGEDNWDGGTNAWLQFNGTTLNVTGSELYRCAIDVAPNGSAYFNGGEINAYRADIQNRNEMEWFGTRLNATESAFLVVEGGRGTIYGGRLHLENGHLIIDNAYDENGGLVNKGSLTMHGGEVTLDNGFIRLAGELYMEMGAILQSMDYRKLVNPGEFAQATVIAKDGVLEIGGEAYLEINGIDKVDGIYNEGIFRQKGGTVAVDVDESIVGNMITAALFGPGANHFENGYTYLEGYNAIVQFNDPNANSRLYVGGNATVDAFGQYEGIITYAPVVFAGGNVHVHAEGEPRTVTREDGTTITVYPTAVVVQNDSEETNASLTIRDGSHYFEVFDYEAEKLAEDGRGLWVVNAPVALTGGELDVEAATALIAQDDAVINVPVIISNETGGTLELAYDETLEAYTAFVGENHARSVAFRTSRNCGENVTWSLEDGVLTISGTGDMDDYYMPIRDPDSWRTAPWYAMRDAITKVVVEEGIKHVGDWAFGRLPEVTEIVYSSTVNRIDMSSNYDCPKLEKFTVAEGNEVYSVSDEGKVLIENGSLVLAAVKTITSYRAGDDIRTIGMGAFDSTDLEELDLNQVTSIQNYAFADCYNLKSVVIPEGVTTIEMTVFQNSGLESITIPTSVTKVRNYAFDGCTALTDVYYMGTESQWNAIIIGSGNNALTRVPVTFLGTGEEVAGDPYLSYRLLSFGDQGYYEDMAEVKTEMTVPVGFYTTMVVYSNVWNEQTEMWERRVVDPEQLYGQDLEINPFRYYQGIGIEEGEPNADHFFEMAVTSGWGETRTLCYDVSEGVVATMPITLTRFNVGFYSEDPTHMTAEQRNAAWLNYYPINPNVSGHSVYFALTEHPADFSSVEVHSDRLTEEDMAKVQVTVVDAEHPSVYKITLPDDVAAKVYDYRGIPIQVTYRIGDQAESETVEFVFGSVSFAGNCVNLVIDGVWYEYYPGLEGYFSWDNENQRRLAYKELPGGMTYDYENDILTMNNSTIESLQLYWNWHNEETGESGYATKDNDLTLKLIGENKIINPHSHAALAVGDGLTMTITGDENSSLLIKATNENATEYNHSASAVNVYNNSDLIIAGDTTVTTFIGSNANMTEGWLMNMWGNGNNTLTIKDNATLTTTVPEGARDNGDGSVDGYEGIGWFGEVRVQDNAALNTTSFGLGDYYDEDGNYHGKGSYVQTGGTVTIEALGGLNPEDRYSYNGFMINGGTNARISGGKLIVKANEDYVAADIESGIYDWFCGISDNGSLEISGSDTVVEIRIPNNGTGMDVAYGELYVRDEAAVEVVGSEHDSYAMTVNEGGNVQLQGGKLEAVDGRIAVRSGGFVEIHDGYLHVSDSYPHGTCLKLNHDANFVLHNGEVVVDKGMDTNDADAVWIAGNMDLNGGSMTVTGNRALGVSDGGNLNQNGAVLTVKGLESAVAADNGGSIWLNGGNTVVTMGEEEQVIDQWYSAVNIYENGYLEVNDGFHRIQVAGVHGQDIWLCALDVRGRVNFNGGEMQLDAGPDGQALWNRETGEITVGFNNGMGAISLEDGTSLFMQDRGNGSFSLGEDQDGFASNAAITNVSAGNEAFWRIEKDGENTTLIISGQWNMFDYYMPQGEAESDWNKTPWFPYKDQITHVVVEDGISHIGDWVFARMTQLVNVRLPGTVYHISTSAFYGCDALESFTMQGNDYANLDDNTCGDPDEDGYRTGTVIIEGGWKVLLAAPSVTEYTVPYYISEIGNGAFQNCGELTEITFEEHEEHGRNLWNIGNNAFANTALTKIELPEGIQAIGRSAFDGCSDATVISLPASVEAIRPYAFSGCGSVETVTFAGNESDWNRISIGSGNGVLDRVVFLDESASEGGEDYLSFRWLNLSENGWQENEHETSRDLYVPAGFTFFGVFYHNHWDEENQLWTADPVIPTAGSGITIGRIDDAMLEEYDWQISEGEPNSAYFVRLITADDAWDTDTVNNGIVTHDSISMDIHIQRGESGFYSSNVASNETWLNDYELNPLKKSNEFYFIFENSEYRVMEDSSLHIWNHDGIPDSYIKLYDVGNGIFRIVLSPIFMQDAWQYGEGFQLWVGYDVYDREGNHQGYDEINLQMKPMDLGNPDAFIEINDMAYLYFAEQNGWMTYGDPANDWRPGVANIPAGVSYDAVSNTLTLSNAKLNNLSLDYRIYDEEGKPTGETHLPNGNLTIKLVGSNVIESGHREALRISGDVNATISGTGSLRIHSHNDYENRDEQGNQYAFDAAKVDNGSTLNIAGGSVTVEISGEGYWRNDEPAMPAALRGRNGSGLVVSGGSLTTVVPDYARDNGPNEFDGEHYYSTHAIGEFDSITVSGGELNTTSLYIRDGETYTQTGGTANITGMGHISWQWDEHGNQYRNYHYNGLQIHQGSEAKISGGELNLTVTPRDWEHGSSSYYNALSIAGGKADISGSAKIHVTGAYDGSAISVGRDYNEHGEPCANGILTMTGGTLTESNLIAGSVMCGVAVEENCTANITGGTLNLTPANGIAEISNRGNLTIGGTAEVNLNHVVWSNGNLTVKGDAKITMTLPVGGNMYAWDIVPGSRFDFESGTITATNAAFMIGGEMWIGEDAVLELKDSDFNADGAIILNGGTLSITQEDLVDNQFLGTVTDEWGNTWDEYAHQSCLYVTGLLELNSGELILQNVPMNIEGSAVVDQNGATVSITNETAATGDRKNNDYDTDDWMVSVRMNEDTALNINGGSFTMTNINFDNGLESNGTININNGSVTITMDNADANSALRANGELNMRGGTLTIDTEGFAALAAQGQTHISGGQVNLSGEVGIHHWYEEGFENGKLTITGGTVSIDAVNTGIDLYNDMVVTGGEIDIDVSGHTVSFTDENGVPVTMLGGCGIMGYNDYKKILISINGGALDIDVPTEAETDYNAVSSFGILSGYNTTVRINGGDIGVRAKAALYAESQENAKHIVINNRMHVLSLDTGNTLDVSSGIVEINRDGETFIWYVDTWEEDEVFTTPYNNTMMDGYASNLRLVSKSAGTNASWDMEDGVLTISAPSGKTGTMAKNADWSYVADKVTALVLDPSVTQPADLSSAQFPNLKTVKTPHNSPAEAFTGIAVEYFHEPEGDKLCTVEGCALATFSGIVEDTEMTAEEKVEAVQAIDNDALKQELENSETSTEQFKQLEDDAPIQVEVAVEARDDHEIPEELDVDQASVVGAKMNAEEDTQKVALVIGASSQTDAVDETQYETVVRFSMELTTTNTENEEEVVDQLKTPVQITLPLPAGMDASRLVILHYHDESGEPEEVRFIHTEVNGQTFVSFWVTGFSDFDFRTRAQKLQVVLDDKTMTYGDEVPVFTWKVLNEDGSEAELPAGVTVVPESVHVTKAGTYTIRAAIQKSGDVRKTIEVVEGRLTVAKKEITVTFEDAELVIGNPLRDFAWEASEALPAGIAVVQKVMDPATDMEVKNITKAGEYIITAADAENDCYKLKAVPGKLTVKKQEVRVIMDAKSMKIGESVPELTYTVMLGDTVLKDHDLEIIPKINQFRPASAGTYVITAFVEEHDIYAVTVVDAKMTVEAKFSFAAANVIMGNNLDMMFAIPKSAISDWSGHYVRIVREYADGRADDVKTVPFAEWTTNSSYYVVTYKGLAAKEMTDLITLTVYDAAGNAVSEPWVDSMRGYVMRQLPKIKNALQRTLMVDMLNYGTMAQDHFNYGEDDYANSQLTEEQKGYASTGKELVTKLNRGDKWVGSNLILKSNIQFMVAFKGLTNDMSAQVQFTGHKGNVVKRMVSGTDFGKNGSYRYVLIDDLVIADVRMPITITIYNSDGSVYTVCNESVEDYLARMTNIGELNTAVMKFADSAYAYLHRND